VPSMGALQVFHDEALEDVKIEIEVPNDKVPQ
jgi:hypothetical protein